MRRLLLLSTALAALTVSTVRAGPGTNLRWTDCFGDGGAFNRSFACDTNAGSNILVSSFQLSEPMFNVVGTEVRIEIVTTTSALPEWWAFKNAGACRQLALSASFTAPPAATECTDWAGGQAAGGIGAYQAGFHGANSRLIAVASALPSLGIIDLSADVEYFAGNVVISNIKTAGGACPGCEVPACLVNVGTKVTTPTPQDDRTLSGATNGTDSYFVTWQGPYGYPPYSRACPYPVATRKETWGAVKALYR